MPSLFKKGDKEGPLAAVFDIGGASIGGLLFRQSKNGLPQVITSLRKPARFSKEMTEPAIWKVVNDVFISVSDEMKKYCSDIPNLALCVFSSPWYVAQTKIIKVERDNPFEIDDKLIRKLIEEEKELFQKQWKDLDATFLEYEPIKTILNGYDSEEPYGKNAKKLELHALFSLGVKQMKKKIEEEILTHVRADSIYLRSFPFILFKILERLTDVKNGALFIDISGGITDIFVLRDGTIEEIDSFQMGENYFVEKLAEANCFDDKSAKSLLLQCEREELDEKCSRETEEILNKASEEWVNRLKKMLSEIAQDKYLPQDLYFCGPATTLREINKRIAEDDFSSFTMFGKPFNVRFLQPNSLEHHFDFIKGFSENKDIFLLLSALFANNFLKA